jgi:hypothetical protein
MNNLQRFSIVAGALVLSAAASLAGNSRPALWIEVKNEEKGLTRIAVTREIAVALVEADDDDSIHVDRHGKGNLITKQMISDVLDGTRDIVRAKDPDDGSEVTLYLKDIDLPRHAGGSGSMVLETYKNGERTFRMKLGEFELEAGGKDDSGIAFGWKRLLPFLSKAGGAVYVNNEREDSEVWVFMD